jgi:hypothetical protein
MAGTKARSREFSMRYARPPADSANQMPYELQPKRNLPATGLIGPVNSFGELLRSRRKSIEPTLTERARPLVAPIVLLGWVAVLAVAIPYWRVSQQQAMEKALREQYGATIGAMGPDAISVTFARCVRLLVRHH